MPVRNGAAREAIPSDLPAVWAGWVNRYYAAVMIRTDGAGIPAWLAGVDGGLSS